jgi:hypothetical protein
MNLGISEEDGSRIFVEPEKVWWLQQRAENKWQVFNIEDPDKITPVVVTGVDTGDLLESSIVIKAKQIRTEFALFKHVDAYAPLGLVADADFTGYRPGACVLDAAIPTNCFAAHRMSGAVPGTDQSIAEIQGTDWPGPIDAPDYELLDPREVKMIKNYFDPTIPVPAAAPGTEESEPDPRIVPVEPPLGVDALVYTDCARLIIQKVTGDPGSLYWDSDARSWMPRSAANAPVVDIGTWDGSYSVEINAGGGLIYGYNWNTQKASEGAGAYRLTFLLEGGGSAGGACDAERSTVFDDTSMSVNVGDRRPATILSATALGGTRGEGGAVYIDVEIGASGGGGGGRPR